MNTFKQNTMNPVSPSTTAPTPLLFQVYSLTHLIDTSEGGPIPTFNELRISTSLYIPTTYTWQPSQDVY